MYRFRFTYGHPLPLPPFRSISYCSPLAPRLWIFVYADSSRIPRRGEIDRAPKMCKQCFEDRSIVHSRSFARSSEKSFNIRRSRRRRSMRRWTLVATKSITTKYFLRRNENQKTRQDKASQTDTPFKRSSGTRSPVPYSQIFFCECARLPSLPIGRVQMDRGYYSGRSVA